MLFIALVLQVSLVRLLLGLRSSPPVQLAAALGRWRAGCWETRAVRTRSHREVQLSEVRCRLDMENSVWKAALKELEVDAVARVTRSVHHAQDAQGQRRVAEAELRRATLPLALQEEATRMRTALQEEKESKAEVEGRLLKVQRQHAAVESQLRQAQERSGRVQRERRHATSDGRASLLHRSLHFGNSWRLLRSLWRWRSAASHLPLPDDTGSDQGRPDQTEPDDMRRVRPNPIEAMWNRFVQNPRCASGEGAAYAGLTRVTHGPI